MTASLGTMRWIWLSAGVVVLDQMTKVWIMTHVDLYERIALLPLLNLTHAHNTGAAFSFLDNAGGWQRWLFAGLALVVAAALVIWLRRMSPAQRWVPIAVALVLGGALGNLYDRVQLGYVVDFIQIYWGDAYFPSFNVADSAIFVGVVMLLIDSLRTPDAGAVQS